jgi:SAM-dependent methyltransferase
MVQLDLNTYSLEERFRLVVQELGRVPDRQELEEVPYFTRILEAIEQVGSFDTYSQRFREMVEVREVPFPSTQQLHTIATIVEREKVIIGDEPGTGKTAPAGSAKYAIERKLGKKVKTVVLCPGYLINNWITNLEQYLEDEPTFCVVTSQDKANDLKRAAREDTDFIFVSYDLLYRDINGDTDENLELRAEVLEAQYSGRKEDALSCLDRFETRERRKATIRRDYEINAGSDLEEICFAIAFEEERREDFEQKTVCSELIKILTNNDSDEATRHPFYLIADEFHNVRDATLKVKTNAFYQLALRARFAAYLSGTKFPDNITNIAVVASAIDDDRFPSPESFIKSIRRNPEAVRRFLAVHEKKPRLTTRDTIGREDPEIERVTYELSELEREVYSFIQGCWDLTEADKLLLLRYATTDRSLVDPDSTDSEKQRSKRVRRILRENFKEDPALLLRARADTTKPTRTVALEKIIDGVPEEDKVVIFCKYSRGVTKPLAEGLNARSDQTFLRVDQSVSSNTKKIRLTREEIRKLEAQGEYSGERYRIDLKISQKELVGLQGKRAVHYSDRDCVALEFQTNPDVKGLVTTFGTLTEGRDLHAANHSVEFHRPYQPGLERQGPIGRISRRGQTKECHVYALQADLTVDLGIDAHLERKKGNIDDIETNRLALSKEDLLSITGGVRAHKEREIAAYLQTESQISRMLLGPLSGGGTEALEELIAGGNARLLASCYNHNWIKSQSANRMRLVAMCIEYYGKDFGNIVDLGSGPATLARILERPTFCVDYLKEMLEYGIAETRSLGFEVEARRGSIHDLRGVGNNLFDLSVTANVLNLLNQKRRVSAVRENIRILKPGGVVIYTLPKSAVEMEEDSPILDQLIDDFEEAGLIINRELTGRYVVTDAIDGNTGAVRTSDKTHFLLAAQVGEGNLREDMFDLKVDYTFSKGRSNGPKKKVTKRKAPEPRGEICVGVRNIDSGLEMKTTNDKFEILRKHVMDAIETGDISPDKVIAAIERLLK